MSRFTSLALPAAIGVVAGMRSMMAPAILTWAAKQGMVRVGGSSLIAMGAGAFSRRAADFAVTELLVDKIPFVPDRTSPGPLAWRTISGAACGAAISTSLRRPAWEGAIMGAAGAVAGTFAAHYARKKSGHTISAGLAEDVLAVGLASLVVWETSRQ